jgi:putative ABC transport system ATP-binding protein
MNATLRVDNLSKHYGSPPNRVVAVDRVSLEIAPGEVVLIMGPSGSGKTTLLSMLGTLLRPSHGSIQLNGMPISDLSEDELPKIRLHEFGFIFQDFHLLSALNTLDNVAIVAEMSGLKRSEARTKAKAILTELRLEDRLRFLPEKLSGGEKQRVAIARALVNNPSLILADEPTANLDSSTGHEVMRLLRHIAKAQHKSVLIVSHDNRIRDIANRVLWLEDGHFKAMAGLATDPVCGMAVERNQDLATDWQGQTYYFCARGCRDEFLEAPEGFLRGAA